MRARQFNWRDLEAWSEDPEQRPAAACLVLYFGSRKVLVETDPYETLRRQFPDAHIVGCSAGGQMLGSEVSDDATTALALDFDATSLRLAKSTITGAGQSRAAGASIGSQLADPTLAGVFVLSDGVKANGSALVDGLIEALGPDVPISGGLASDGMGSIETLVGGNARPEPGAVVAVGFYGDAIRFGHGSAGGWDVFGPKRRITKSTDNLLYELDGKPALDLYKLYLGPEETRNLPGSALLFPMRISDPDHPARTVVRTVRSVDSVTGAMNCAGDMPEGWIAQLMYGSYGRLCAGAAQATRQAVGNLDAAPGADSAAILVSCVGRRVLMGQRVDEEIEAINAELPGNCRQVGFYSFGEISPHGVPGKSQFHNQTMTVTLLSEKAA